VAMTPERKVKARVEAILREAGAYYFFPATHGYGRSGVPDIIACLDGGFLAIECKAGKGKPTALQMRELDRVRTAGGAALLVNEETMYMVYDAIKALRV
jgi:Holliday junction resolvase